MEQKRNNNEKRKGLIRNVSDRGFSSFTGLNLYFLAIIKNGDAQCFKIERHAV